MKISAKRYAQALYQTTVNASPPERDKIIKRFIELLAKHNKLGQIDNIITEFSNYASQQQELVTVNATTANKLSGTAEKTVTNHLTKLLKSSVAVKFQIDPTILGGIIIKFSDTIIDGSLKRAVNDLKKSLASST